MIDGRALVKDFEASEAGQALKAKGFRAQHQGGGLVNFERIHDGKLYTVIAGLDSGGYGQRALSEPVDVLVSLPDRSSEPGELGSETFATLTAFLATL